MLDKPKHQTLEKKAENSKPLPLTLQNQVMSVLKHASQACTKPFITLKANQVSSASTLLKPCLLKLKVKTKKEKRREDEERGRRIEHDICNFFLSKMPVLDVYLKNQLIHFLVHAHSLWSTLASHMVKGPKALELAHCSKR